jgi:hypothetical protein
MDPNQTYQSIFGNEDAFLNAPMFIERTGEPGVVPANSGEPQLPLPPLLVLWAWHSHLMNPANYALELQERYVYLSHVSFPLRAAVSLSCLLSDGRVDVRADVL